MEKCYECKNELTDEDIKYLDGSCSNCESKVDWYGRYQYREIGESGWEDCSKDHFDHCDKSPLYDTRIL